MILLAADTTTLSLQAFNHNEFGDSPDFYDRLSVNLITGSGIVVLASTSPFDGAAVVFPYWTGTDVYQSLALDISAYAGQSVQIQFSYNTIDGFDNGHPGGRIDNVSIDGLATPEPSTLLGLGIAGLATIGYFRRKTA